MARYIDADKIDYTVTMAGMDENAGYRAVAFESDIDAMPTADVAPRAEVEELREAYNYRLAKDIQTNADFVRYATAEVAREIFEEIEKFRDRTPFGYICFSLDEFEKIKKKYTEDKTNDNK